ncbi:hypothetical protein BDR07DRAFT_1488802 [Suillus spraguei]|nr:hypothetical protein BDR07DRAFT_1488802 [Suillus spraguei]
MGSLAIDETSSSDDALNEYIFSDFTEFVNHSLKPTKLDDETQTINAKSCDLGIKAKKVKSAKSKEPTEGPKPTQLGWYPPWWKTFLDDAKAECHAQHAIKNAFPDSVKDLPLLVTKALTTSLIEWLEAGNEVEAGIWPDHKADMAKLAAAIIFFYTGLYCIAHRRPDIFQEELPLQALASVCAVYTCVFDGLVKNGSGKYFPKFPGKDYSSVYFSMIVELKNVMKDAYHGPKLIQQLLEWAAEGWQGAFFQNKWRSSLIKSMQGAVLQTQQQGHINALSFVGPA